MSGDIDTSRSRPARSEPEYQYRVRKRRSDLRVFELNRPQFQTDPTSSSTKTAVLTVAAMVAFAANSLLCRLALDGGLIDAATFTSVRVVSGALVLLLIVSFRQQSRSQTAVDWRLAAALFIYMAFFSFAYLSLSAGTGALLLFGAVQLTMFVAALREGERLSAFAWAGFVLALIGLGTLLFPGLTAPDPLGAALMVVAGVAWGLYSLLGKGVAEPLRATASSFVYAVPLAILLSIGFIRNISVTQEGLMLAVASGAAASGIGYALWYAALRGLTASYAATVQLSVPVLTAVGGVVLLTEPLTLRLVIASVAVLGGITIVLTQLAPSRRGPEA